VIDAQQRLFGYPDCLVVDGSTMSANPGVNPSLTITAMAERALALVPPKA
jgi:cholesterol oxidase